MAVDKTVVRMEVPYFQVPNNTFEVGMDKHQLLVYMFLCRCGNHGGRAFPSYTTIAAKCDISRKTAIEVCKALVGKGLLLKTTRENSQGGHVTNIYEVAYPEKKEIATLSQSANAEAVNETSNPFHTETIIPAETTLANSMNPSVGATPPSVGATPPSVGATPPSVGATPPSVGATPPSVGATPPSVRATPPSVGATPYKELYIKNQVIKNQVIKNTQNASAREETNGTVLGENGFEEFWNAYPKKTGRQTSQVVWNQYNPTPEFLSRIMTFLSKEKASRQWQTEGGRYIPKPENWLSQRRWEDEQALTQDMIDAEYLREPDFIALYGKGGVGRGKNSVHPRDAPGT